MLWMYCISSNHRFKYFLPICYTQLYFLKRHFDLNALSDKRLKGPNGRTPWNDVKFTQFFGEKIVEVFGLGDGLEPCQLSTMSASTQVLKCGRKAVSYVWGVGAQSYHRIIRRLRFTILWKNYTHAYLYERLTRKINSIWEPLMTMCVK